MAAKGAVLIKLANPTVLSDESVNRGAFIRGNCGEKYYDGGGMRYFLLAFSLVLSVSAQTLTKGERDRAMSELHASRKQLIDAVSGLSEKQLAFQPSPGAWSIAEITEHLAMTEELLFSLHKQTAAAPADPAKSAAQKDEELLKSIRTRDQKVKAPEMVHPKKTFASTAQALAAFKERRDRTIAFVETTDGDNLRHKIVPNFGMDAYQIFLLMAAHTQRHVEQINEVKAAASR
jgi:hypothetical protein